MIIILIQTCKKKISAVATATVQPANCDSSKVCTSFSIFGFLFLCQQISSPSFFQSLPLLRHFRRLPPPSPPSSSLDTDKHPQMPLWLIFSPAHPSPGAVPRERQHEPGKEPQAEPHSNTSTLKRSSKGREEKRQKMKQEGGEKMKGWKDGRWVEISFKGGWRDKKRQE